MEIFEMPVLVPFWLLATFILGFFTVLGLYIVHLYWARGPASALIQARWKKRIPILYRLSTGQVGIRLVKHTPQYFEISKYRPAFIPAVEESKGKPDFWESVRQPCFFVDERKTLALTIDDVALFNEAIISDNPGKADEEEKAMLTKILDKLKEQKKLTVSLFDRLSFEEIQKYISDRWNESVMRAYGRDYEARGKKAAGFNMASFSILAGIAFLFFTLAIIAQWMGVF